MKIMKLLSWWCLQACMLVAAMSTGLRNRNLRALHREISCGGLERKATWRSTRRRCWEVADTAGVRAARLAGVARWPLHFKHRLRKALAAGRAACAPTQFVRAPTPRIMLPLAPLQPGLQPGGSKAFGKGSFDWGKGGFNCLLVAIQSEYKHATLKEDLCGDGIGV